MLLIGVLLLFVLILLSFALMVLPNSKNAIITIAVIQILLGGVICILITFGEYQTYKNAQIDAVTNNMKFELKTQPNSTIIWVKKEQN